MELRDYLHKYRIKTHEFAKKTDFSVTYILAVKNGHATPGKRFIKAVIEATNGEVTEKDLLKE